MTKRVLSNFTLGLLLLAAGHSWAKTKSIKIFSDMPAVHYVWLGSPLKPRHYLHLNATCNDLLKDKQSHQKIIVWTDKELLSSGESQALADKLPSKCAIEL